MKHNFNINKTFTHYKRDTHTVTP